MHSYILTGNGRRVTATLAPLMREDVLIETDGRSVVRWLAEGAETLRWVRA